MAADDGSKIPSPFDVRTIKDLVALMSRHDLSEIDLREGDLRIRLRRGRREAAAPSPAVPAPAPAAPPAAANAEPTKPARALATIKSPTPGTFYSAPTPDAEPFVRVGTRVTPTTTVCIIEAMKIFNEIPADCSGVIAEVLVENQQPVEYGQVLFKVDPAG
ncbi:MAG TPA: acetyl-CoA carboxylase biotin carboxyl carrier protein [Gemmataceae bacterium]|jgi:acetyl-CoA carboxylase biotin carboxyl carrier protein|nr:acetyl-CoA carboxylase biotin carboxyl carrier protein [Gemmataceae bacterium]